MSATDRPENETTGRKAPLTGMDWDDEDIMIPTGPVSPQQPQQQHREVKPTPAAQKAEKAGENAGDEPAKVKTNKFAPILPERPAPVPASPATKAEPEGKPKEAAPKQTPAAAPSPTPAPTPAPAQASTPSPEGPKAPATKSVPEEEGKKIGGTAETQEPPRKNKGGRPKGSGKKKPEAKPEAKPDTKPAPTDAPVEKKEQPQPRPQPPEPAKSVAETKPGKPAKATKPVKPVKAKAGKPEVAPVAKTTKKAEPKKAKTSKANNTQGKPKKEAGGKPAKPTNTGEVAIPEGKPRGAKLPASETGVPKPKIAPATLAIWGLGAFACTLLAVFGYQFLQPLPRTPKNPFPSVPATGNTNAQTPVKEQRTGIIEAEAKQEAFFETKDPLPRKPNQFAVLETSVLEIKKGKEDPDRVYMLMEVPEEKGHMVVGESSTKALVALVAQEKIKQGAMARITLTMLSARAARKYETDRKMVEEAWKVPEKDFFDIEEYESVTPKAAANPAPNGEQGPGPNPGPNANPNPNPNPNPEAPAPNSPETTGTTNGATAPAASEPPPSAAPAPAQAPPSAAPSPAAAAGETNRTVTLGQAKATTRKKL